MDIINSLSNEDRNAIKAVVLSAASEGLIEDVRSFAMKLCDAVDYINKYGHLSGSGETNPTNE